MAGQLEPAAPRAPVREDVVASRCQATYGGRSMGGGVAAPEVASMAAAHATAGVGIVVTLLVDSRSVSHRPAAG